MISTTYSERGNDTINIDLGIHKERIKVNKMKEIVRTI